MAIEITCDKCGTRVVQEGRRLTLYGWRGPAKSANQYDLCDRCYEDVKKYIGKGEVTDGEDETPY
jgi:hypothetical protein